MATASAGADACQAMLDCIEHHLRGEHTPCNSITAYKHDNLATRVGEVLPDGWTVVQPGAPAEGPEPPDAPSQYPLDTGGESQMALHAFLLDKGVEEAFVEDLDLKNKLDGHCETVAASCAEQVIATLRGDSSPEQALRTAFDAMVEALKAADIREQVALLFEPEARKMKSEERFWEACGRAMWDPLLPDVDALPGPEKWLVSLTAGATEQWPTLLRQVAEHVPAAGSPGADGVFALPLYVVNYVWNDNELTLEQMNEWDRETACYSVHCIGLVFDQRAKAVLMVDPNGPLLMGGGMEFLCVPHAKLPPDCKASTCMSQYDREKHLSPPPAPAKSKKGGNKKRKRK